MQMKPSLILGLIATMSLSACTSSGEKAADISTNTQAPPAQTTPATQAEPTSTTDGGKVYEGTINGVISDSMCGKDHSKMGETGKDPAKCIAECVASGAKYVLVDDKGESYSLSDQGKTKELAGQHVAVTGHIDPSTKAIHVHSIVSQ